MANNSPSFFEHNYGVSPSPPAPPASNLRSQYKEEIDRLSEKVTTYLSDGTQEQVYKQSNIIKLKELYDIIKKRPVLYQLKDRIEDILEEHGKVTQRIIKEHGLGFLKKRKMRKSRKPVKGRKTKKTRK